uniref:C2H2-type domain-containing protein n=1 Tax=viral metagenome TaxID=1070528 RepID=A0A6C0HY22_9ZZZZ
MTSNYQKLENVYIDFDENGNIITKQKIGNINNEPPQPTQPTQPNELCQPPQKKQKTDINETINKILENEPNEGPYECTICNNTFVKKSYWKRHVLSHNGKFACDTCGREFSHHHHLNQHMKVHKERENACDICGMKIRFKFNIKKHRATHIPYTDENGNVKYLC